MSTIDKHLRHMVEETRKSNADTSRKLDVLLQHGAERSTLDTVNQGLNILIGLAQDNAARLARVEHALRNINRVEHQVESDLMAKVATDQALILEVHRTTDVGQAAVKAIQAQTASIADLTSKLAAAIAESDASDDADVLATLAELKASNDATAAATPAIAAAIANTDPNAPVQPVTSAASA